MAEQPSPIELAFRAVSMVDSDRERLQLKVNRVRSDLRLVEIHNAPGEVTHSRDCWRWHIVCLAKHIESLLKPDEGEPR